MKSIVCLLLFCFCALALANHPQVSLITTQRAYDNFLSYPAPLKVVMHTAQGTEYARMAEELIKNPLLSPTKLFIAINSVNATKTTPHPAPRVDVIRAFPKEPQSVVSYPSNTDDNNNNDENNNKNQITKESLAKFVINNALPIVTEATLSNYALFAARELPRVWFFIDTKNPQHHAAIDSIRSVARDYSSHAVYGYVDNRRWVSRARMLGLTQWNPGVVIEDTCMQNGEKMGLDKKYIYPTDTINPTDFALFMQGFVNKTLPKSIRSLPPPAQPVVSEHGVITVVGSTFRSVVDDVKKDVLVWLRAPTSSGCRALAPIYDQIGAHFAQDENVVVAWMDATQNDVDEEGIAMLVYPMVLFYPAGEKGKMIKFNGEKTFEEVVKFVEENRASVVAQKSKHDEL